MRKLLNCLEHRMGFEPMNTGFADQRVSHFATGALVLLWLRRCPQIWLHRLIPGEDLLRIFI
jgi:hypothetical protein